MIKENLKKQILDHYSKFLREKNHGHYKKYADKKMSIDKLFSSTSTFSQINNALNYYSIPQTGRVLDVGCSFSSFIFDLYKKGNYDFVAGIDPDKTAVTIANLYQEYSDISYTELSIMEGNIYQIPFESNYFDLIVFKDVGEHLGCYKNFLRATTELHRVLKSGGHIFMETPNYLFPLEVHLKIPTIPYIPSKKIAKGVAKLFKRDASFIDHLFFITPRQATKAFKSSFTEVKNIYVDYKVSKVVDNPTIISSRFKPMIPFLFVIKQLRLKKLLCFIFKVTQLYPTLWYIVKK